LAPKHQRKILLLSKTKFITSTRNDKKAGDIVKQNETEHKRSIAQGGIDLSATI